MNKLTTILFISVFFSAASIAEKVVETWECTEVYGSKVLVMAKILEGREFGEIDVADIIHQSQYSVQGFNRRWDFGLRDDGRFKYALIIKPNGSGLYYEFPELSAEVSASMVLECSN